MLPDDLMTDFIEDGLVTDTLRRLNALEKVTRDLVAADGGKFGVAAYLASANIFTAGQTVKPDVDTLTALVVNDKDGNNVLTVDTINNRVGILKTTPGKTLDVTGDIRLSVGLFMTAPTTWSDDKAIAWYNGADKIGFLGAVDKATETYLSMYNYGKAGKASEIYIETYGNSGYLDGIYFYVNSIICLCLEKSAAGKHMIRLNDWSEDVDTQIKGDTEENLFYADASANKIGLGLSNPASRLEIKSTSEATPFHLEGTATACFIGFKASGAMKGYVGWTNSGDDGMCFLNSGGGTVNVIITDAGKVGIADTAPAEKLDVTGNINCTGVYKVDDVQVVSNRVIDARCDDAINCGDATTDGVIDSLRDAMISHGLVAAA